MDKGMIQIYTGDGKGKSTAACGLACRCAGQGLRVWFVQFLKTGSSGELEILRQCEKVTVECSETKKFVWDMTPQEVKQETQACGKFFEKIKKQAGQYDLIVLDEIMGCLQNGFLQETLVADFLRGKPEQTELVLTGRNAPASLVGLADYVTEMQEVKHPMNRGVPARRGIEF